MTTIQNTDTQSLSDLHDHELERHLAALGLRTVDEYVNWCADHGFSNGSKSTGTSGARNGTLRCNTISSPDLLGRNTNHAIPERSFSKIARDEIDCLGSHPAALHLDLRSLRIA